MGPAASQQHQNATLLQPGCGILIALASKRPHIHLTLQCFAEACGSSQLASRASACAGRWPHETMAVLKVLQHSPIPVQSRRGSGSKLLSKGATVSGKSRSFRAACPTKSGTSGEKPSLQTEVIKTPWMGLQTGSCHWMGHRKVYNSRSYGVTLLPRAPDRGLTPARR